MKTKEVEKLEIKNQFVGIIIYRTGEVKSAKFNNFKDAKKFTTDNTDFSVIDILVRELI